MWHRKLDAWETTYPRFVTLVALRRLLSSEIDSRSRARRLLANRFDRPESEVTLTYSGTAAVDLALRRAEVAPGTEVVLPDYVCPTVAAAVQNCGCRPVVVDVTWPSLTIDVDTIDTAITSETGAILVPHVNGQQAPVEEIADHWDDLVIIEDAAQGLACSLTSKELSGDVIVLSFSNKHIGVGKGGALIDSTGHDDAGLSSPTLRQEIAAAKVNSDSFGLSMLAAVSYALADAGYGFGRRLARVPSVLLEDQVRHLDHLFERRRRHAETYEVLLRRAIDAKPDIEILTRGTDAGVPLQFQIAIPSGGRENLLARLKERNIHATPGWSRVSESTARDDLRTVGPRSNSERAEEAVLGLPIPPGAATEQIELAGREVLEWARSR